MPVFKETQKIVAKTLLLIASQPWRKKELGMFIAEDANLHQTVRAHVLLWVSDTTWIMIIISFPVAYVTKLKSLGSSLGFTDPCIP